MDLKYLLMMKSCSKSRRYGIWRYISSSSDKFVNISSALLYDMKLGKLIISLNVSKTFDDSFFDNILFILCYAPPFQKCGHFIMEAFNTCVETIIFSRKTESFSNGFLVWCSLMEGKYANVLIKYIQFKLENCNGCKKRLYILLFFHFFFIFPFFCFSIFSLFFFFYFFPIFFCFFIFSHFFCFFLSTQQPNCGDQLTRRE